MGKRINGIDPLRVLWIDIQLVVVLWAAGHVVGTFFPAFTKIGASIDTLVFFICLDNRVDHVLVRWSGCQADPAQITIRQTAFQLTPGVATVHGLVNTALWTAIDQRPNMAPSLVAGCHDLIRSGCIDHKFIDTGVFIDFQNTFPVFTTIGGPIQTPVSPRAPQWALGRDIDGIAVFGMKTDHRDMTGVFQPHVFPALAAIE